MNYPQLMQGIKQMIKQELWGPEGFWVAERRWKE